MLVLLHHSKPHSEIKLTRQAPPELDPLEGTYHVHRLAGPSWLHVSGVGTQGLDSLSIVTFQSCSIGRGQGNVQSLQNDAEPDRVTDSRRYGSSLYSQALTLLN